MIDEQQPRASSDPSRMQEAQMERFNLLDQAYQLTRKKEDAEMGLFAVTARIRDLTNFIQGLEEGSLKGAGQ